MDAGQIPDHTELRAILTTKGAPPHIILDVGGSADLNGDGLVEVSLDERGELVFRDV
jgi:hypothetical protein